ncbi:hypothetical protein [Cupriavidus gilardii]|uniref:Uncharacterized protein n=1 Tax=Cupriavidus gilardii TaxID=82541 RepID=A0A849BEK4_9BURK|nr:hypothetical protein [Cupriavidus gilardii]KAB0597774.1 hypothetical protein F7Q96_07590 [Cupriavidus gilardii]NNH12065.1 hypothetical protein [Cupriavidus gilardii]WNG69302.1 hypothetical protein QWJ31_19575 [Cupriavidus gilardii]
MAELIEELRWSLENGTGGPRTKEALRRAIAALDRHATNGQRAGVPEGYVLMPVELTPEMIKAGANSGGLGMNFLEWMGRLSIAWRHMLAAAPTPDIGMAISTVPEGWRISQDEEGIEITSPSGDGCYLWDIDQRNADALRPDQYREVFRQLCQDLIAAASKDTK